MVSLMQPGTSWVSRWLRMRYTDEDGHTVAFLPGVYAISLPGEVRLGARCMCGGAAPLTATSCIDLAAARVPPMSAHSHSCPFSPPSLTLQEAMAASGAGRRGAGGDEDEYEDDEEEAEDEGEEEDADDDVGGSSSSSGKKGAAASKGGKGKGGRGAGAGAGSSSSSSSSSSAAAAAEAPSSGPSLFRPAGARAAAPVAPDRDDPDALDAAVHAATVPQDERDDE